MRTIVKGKNYEVPEKVRDYAERKLGRLERILDDRSDATVEAFGRAASERAGLAHRRRDPRHRRPDAAQLRVRADAPRRHRYRARQDRAPGGGPPGDEPRPQVARDGPRFGGLTATAGRTMPPTTCAARSRRSSASTSSPCSRRMPSRGWRSSASGFFVFVNAENERVAILYRRREGGYGLIEPVVGGGYTKGGPPGRSRAT